MIKINYRNFINLILILNAFSHTIFFGMTNPKLIIQELPTSLKNLSAQKISCLANLLVYQKILFTALKSIKPFTQVLLETSKDKESVYNFAPIYNKDNLINSIKSEGYKKLSIEDSTDLFQRYNCINLCTPEAQSFCTSMLIHLRNDREKNNNFLLKTYNYLDNLSNNQYNNEIKLVIEERKNIISKALIHQIIANKLILIFPLINIRINNQKPHVKFSQQQISQIEATHAIEANNVINIIKKWIEDINLTVEVNRMIPDLIPLCTLTEKFANLFNKFYLQENESFRLINCQESKLIDQFLERLIDRLESKQDYYQKLYTQLLLLSKNLYSKIEDRKNLNKFRLKTAHSLINEILPCSIESSNPEFIRILQSIEIPWEESTQNVEEDKEDHPIKSQKKSNHPKKSSKKKHRRPQRSKSNEEKEEKQNHKKLEKQIKDTTTYLNLPQYSPRVLKWFKSEYTNDKKINSILYHTYNPIADILIKKYGVKRNRQNKTYNTQDTAYFMLGIIKYNDSSTQNVIFVNCYDHNNICYHRGIEHKNGQEIFNEVVKNNVTFKFPEPKLDQFHTNKLILSNSENYLYPEKYFKENDFCIYMEDPKNEVSLILFKQINI